MMALYSNEGNGLFIDEAPTSTIGKASLLTLTFACFFFDFDLDGLLDIFAANGHVADDISTRAAEGHLRAAAAPVPQPRRQEVRGDLEHGVGAGVRSRPSSARGAAYGDFDNDGDLDLLITANNGPARLLRNDGGNRQPVGCASKRSARRTATASARASACTLDDGRNALAHGEDRIELSARRASCR